MGSVGGGTFPAHAHLTDLRHRRGSSCPVSPTMVGAGLTISETVTDLLRDGGRGCPQIVGAPVRSIVGPAWAGRSGDGRRDRGDAGKGIPPARGYLIGLREKSRCSPPAASTTDGAGRRSDGVPGTIAGLLHDSGRGCPEIVGAAVGCIVSQAWAGRSGDGQVHRRAEPA